MTRLPGTFEGVVKEALRLVYEKDLDPPQAVIQVFNSGSMRREEIDRAAIKGLIAEVNYQRSLNRGRVAESPVATDIKHGTRPQIPQRRLDPRAFFGSIEYTVNGAAKSFLDFHVADWTEFAAACGAKEKSYRTRREFAQKAKAAQLEHGALRFSDLPDDAQQRLYRDAQRVQSWRVA